MGSNANIYAAVVALTFFCPWSCSQMVRVVQPRPSKARTQDALGMEKLLVKGKDQRAVNPIMYADVFSWFSMCSVGMSTNCTV